MKTVRVVLLVLLLSMFLTLHLSAQQGCSGAQLNAGQRLNTGACLQSPSGQFALTLKNDGDLVLSNVATGTVEWSSATSGQPVSYGLMQPDGNFVLYAATGTAVWATNTLFGASDYRASVQDNGAFGVLKQKSTNGTVVYNPIWASAIEVHITAVNGQLVPSKDAVAISKNAAQRVKWYNDTSEDITIAFENGTPFGNTTYSIRAGGSKSSGLIQAESDTIWSYGISTASGPVTDPQVIIEP